MQPFQTLTTGRFLARVRIETPTSKLTQLTRSGTGAFRKNDQGPTFVTQLFGIAQAAPLPMMNRKSIHRERHVPSLFLETFAGRQALTINRPPNAENQPKRSAAFVNGRGNLCGLSWLEVKIAGLFRVSRSLLHAACSISAPSGSWRVRAKAARQPALKN